MKKLLFVFVLCAGLSFMSQAQDTSRVTQQDTSEHMAKGMEKSMDKMVKDKTGPNGEAIYKTKDNRYYWIEQDGTKHFANKNELKKAKTKPQ